ncbi:glycosyltransferase family 2 protein [Microvirga sp. 2MCAF38]|uniref:glycosyltransferase family 2 protein n=1 Tax=Microvirga sp. 2MCAF38 TaxID=3232989 RepID=UPI003F95AAE7
MGQPKTGGGMGHMHGGHEKKLTPAQAFASRPGLSVVVPCYNEEECIRACHERLTAVCQGLAVDYELVFVNDGSADRTAGILLDLKKSDPRIVIVDLARNHGHQLALSAGLSVALGERVFVIDADLQDPPELLGEMMKVMDAGADVVYGQRRAREGESWFKLATAKLFYRALSRIAAFPIPHDTGDFRLMSRQVVDILNSMPESHRFIRGMVAWIGFDQVPMLYDRHARFAGETKYPFGKMLLLASDAMTAFAVAPLRFVYSLALVAALLAVLMIGWSFFAYLLNDTSPGWASLMVVVLAFSSVQLFCLGVIGEYISRIFTQVKGRPLFVIKAVHRDQSSRAGHSA